MRTCIRCGAEMIENLNPRTFQSYAAQVMQVGISTDGGGASIHIKAAVCPQCREVSLYLDEDSYLGLQHDIVKKTERRF